MCVYIHFMLMHEIDHAVINLTKFAMFNLFYKIAQTGQRH